MGGDLGGIWGDGPPKFEVGDGPCNDWWWRLLLL